MYSLIPDKNPQALLSLSQVPQTAAPVRRWSGDKAKSTVCHPPTYMQGASNAHTRAHTNTHTQRCCQPALFNFTRIVYIKFPEQQNIFEKALLLCSWNTACIDTAGNVKSIINYFLL